MLLARKCAALWVPVALVAGWLAGQASAGSASADGPAVAAPLASRSLLLDIARAGDTLVAVGERGHVLLSSDHGKSWTQSAGVPSRTMLTAVTFANADLGWAVGHDEIILRTEDGGRNWLAANYQPNHQQPLLDVWAENASHVIAIGAYGSFYESNDGGRNWTSRKFQYQALPKKKSADGLDEDIPPDYHLNKLLASDSHLFIAAEAGQLFRSDDGGASWRQLPSPYNGSFFGLLAPEPGRLIAFGLRGRLFRSDDAGQTWTSIATGVDAMLTDGFMQPDGELVLVGLSGTVLVSSDRGASWTLHQQPDRKGNSAALPVGTGELVAVGESGTRRISFNGK